MSCLKDFDFIKKIGKGCYSSVHKVKHKINENIYALKMVKMG